MRKSYANLHMIIISSSSHARIMRILTRN